MKNEDATGNRCGLVGPNEKGSIGLAARRALLLGRKALVLGWIAILVGCGGGGGDVADSGGMSGTGISQGAISAFGSIFVNGVRWDISSANIAVDDAAATENDLRVGMVVRVEGNFDAGNLTGTAFGVDFESLVEGPVENAPVETVPGQVKVFTILGQTISVEMGSTIFDDGASFAGLSEDDVLEVSGFEDATGQIQATLVSLRGVFPADNEVERFGVVSGLVTSPDGSGIFDLGPLTIRYAASTEFSDFDDLPIGNGDRVEVEGTLRLSGSEIDATEIEREEEGISVENLERIEVEGVAAACPESMDFCVSGIPVDLSSAIFDPTGFVPIIGDEVEIEGPLIAGVLVAERVESEEEDSDLLDVEIEAAVTSVNASARTLVILGVTVIADGDTVIEDGSDEDDENFMFSEIGVGDFLEVEGVSEGDATVRAISIERDDAMAGDDEVRLEGPVTMLDTVTPALSILGQPIPLDGGTLYFNESGASRSEEQFFRVPGDVMLGDIVRAQDNSALDLSALGEADEIEIEEDDD